MNTWSYRAAILLFAAGTLIAVGCTENSVPSMTPTPDDSGELSVIAPAGAKAPTRHTGPQGVVGQFVTDCGLSHSAAADPIVYPERAGGRPEADEVEPAHATHAGHGAPGGKSHMHNFFGNTTTDSASTLKSLLKGGTTCKKQLDTAAYWTPQLLDHGEPVTPTKSTAYYRAGKGVDSALLKSYPPGLKIVAGDASATEAQPVDLAGWTCGTSSIQQALPPDCPDSAPLRGVVTFPDCWDGMHTDSADHRSHMANSSDGLCPASHPVHVPQLMFAVTYPVSGIGHDLSLLSGSLYGFHSDFINAWHQESLEQEIDLCLKRDVVCALSSNRGEDALFATG